MVLNQNTSHFMCLGRNSENETFGETGNSRNNY